MRLLIDTHCWLWMGLDSKRLGKKTRALFENHEHELVLSVASAWEIAIKAARGKLKLPQDPAPYVQTRTKLSRVNILQIDLEHVLATASLPDYHQDPFDRLLIAQAQVESMTIVTADERIAQYDVLVHHALK